MKVIAHLHERQLRGRRRLVGDLRRRDADFLQDRVDLGDDRRQRLALACRCAGRRTPPSPRRRRPGARSGSRRARPRPPASRPRRFSSSRRASRAARRVCVLERYARKNARLPPAKSTAAASSGSRRRQTPRSIVHGRDSARRTARDLERDTARSWRLSGLDSVLQLDGRERRVLRERRDRRDDGVAVARRPAAARAGPGRPCRRRGCRRTTPTSRRQRLLEAREQRASTRSAARPTSAGELPALARRARRAGRRRAPPSPRAPSRRRARWRVSSAAISRADVGDVAAVAREEPEVGDEQHEADEHEARRRREDRPVVPEGTAREVPASRS